MSRKHLRAAPIPIRPATVTQQTALSVLGMTERQFLDTLTAHPEIPRAKVGRLRIVRVDDMERWLLSLSETGQSQDATDDDFPRSVDEGLRGLGYERAPSNQARRKAG